MARIEELMLVEILGLGHTYVGFTPNSVFLKLLYGYLPSD